MTNEEKQDRDLPEGIVRRPGTTTLYMRFMLYGERISKSTGTSNPREAEKRKNAEKARLEKEHYMQSQLTTEQKALLKTKLKPSPTFKEFVAAPDPKTGFGGGLFWTGYATKTYCGGHQGWTRDYYKNRVAQAIKYAPLATAKLNEITAGLILDYIGYRRMEHKIKPGTVNKEITALNVILTQAVAQNFIATVPVMPKKDRKIKSPGKAMRPDEQEIYFGDHESINTDLRDYAMILINTGLEPGPMRELDWKNVHFETSDRYPFGFIHGDSHKTETRERDRAMSMELSIYMCARWERMKSPETGKVFPEQQSRSAFQHIHDRRLGRIRREGAPKFRHFRLYDFRHTFLTRYWAATKNMMALKEAAGWKTLRQAETYIHQNEDDFRQADEQLMKYLQYLGTKKAAPTAAIEPAPVVAD